MCQSRQKNTKSTNSLFFFLFLFYLSKKNSKSWPAREWSKRRSRLVVRIRLVCPRRLRHRLAQRRWWWCSIRSRRACPSDDPSRTLVSWWPWPCAHRHQSMGRCSCSTFQCPWQLSRGSTCTQPASSHSCWPPFGWFLSSSCG